GRRNWKRSVEARDAVYRNRRRIRGARGQRRLRLRGELLERRFAHLYETGGMRGVHLRGHTDIRKRLLIHTAGFNRECGRMVGAAPPRITARRATSRSSGPLSARPWSLRNAGERCRPFRISKTSRPRGETPRRIWASSTVFAHGTRP